MPALSFSAQQLDHSLSARLTTLADPIYLTESNVDAENHRC